MGKVAFMAAVCGAAALLAPASVSALKIAEDDILCPLESIGESDMEDWGPMLAANSGQLNERQLDVLVSAILECSQKLGWSESDAASSMELNLAILGSTAIGDKLLLSGVNAQDYEKILEGRTAEELQQMLADPDNSPTLDQLAVMMVENLGDNLTDQIAGDLGTYIAFTAQTRFATMKMVGFAD